MSAPDWETSKENVMPVASGRNVNILNKALSKQPAELDAERLALRTAITDAAKGIGPYAADPLAPWVAYVKWAVDNFPRGSDFLAAAVEGACRKFTKDPRYLNDRRFVRLWMRYADMRKDKLDVFDYMQRRRIGEHIALFYEARATTYELERQFEKAEETYALGKQIGAEPLARLTQREREFFARMAARRRRAEKKAQEAAEKKAAAVKVDNISNTGRGRNALADNILSRPDSHGSGDLDIRALDGENVAPGASQHSGRMVRPALGSITEHQAHTGRRPMGHADHGSSAMLQSVTGTRPPLQNNGKRKADNIDVYVDPEPAKVSPMTAHQMTIEQSGKFRLPLLSKRDEVTKENDGKLPSKWAGETLPQEEKLRNRLNRGVAAPQQQFEIYQDPANNEPAAASHDASPTADGSVSEDAMMDGKIDNVKSRSRSPSPIRKRPTRPSAVSPTINTKIAIQEVDDLFNSSLAVELNCEESSAQKLTTAIQSIQKPVVPFEIFKDSDDADKENALGVVRGPSGGVERPSDDPEMEKRVLQPIPELEGPYIRRMADDAVDDENQDPKHRQGGEDGIKNGGIVSSPEESDVLLDFLAEWCYQDPSYFLLDGPDPEVERAGSFELHPKQNTMDSDQFGFSTFKPHTVISFDVDDVLWNGHEGNSKVVAVEDMDNIFGLQDPEKELDGEENYIALKVSKVPNAWEYYIYKTIHDRYGAPLKSVATPVAFYEGSPQSYLLLDSVFCCSLSEAMKFNGSTYLSESLAMFFTADLLRTLEALHTVGIIHSDVTLDNVLFRNNLEEDLVEERYVASGGGSWTNKGVLLVDFNHAVDSKQALLESMGPEDLSRYMGKKGNSFLDEEFRIPGATTWSFNADCYATAVCSSKMLGFSKLGAKDCAQPLKHSRIWELYFAAMQNLSATTKCKETVDTMRRCREEMEGALVEEKWLKASIERLSSTAETHYISDKTMGPA